MSLVSCRWMAAIVAVLALACASCTERTGDSGGVASLVRSYEADGASMLIELSGTRITTAERLEATIRVRGSVEDFSISGIDLETLAPDAPEGTFWTVESIEQERAEPGMIETRVSLEPFLPGIYEFPALSIVVTTGTRETTLESEGVVVEVVSVLGESDGEQALADLKEIVGTPARSWLWLWIVLGFGLVAALVGLVLLVRFLRIRAARRFATLALAHEVALHRLGRLEETRSADGAGIESFLDDASLVLRRYIEDRFGVHAPERTTEEFLREAEGSMQFRSEDVELLGRFLSRVDFIKFAGAAARGSQAGEAIDLIRGFVDRTADPNVWIVVDDEESRALTRVMRVPIPPEDRASRAEAA